jgi:hypothetical protein
MQLLSDEEILVSSNQDKIILTNQRIHQSDKQWGRSYQITLFLENISSIEALYKSNLILLVLAVVTFLAGLFAPAEGYMNDGTIRFGCFMFSIIFLAFWFYSKQQTVTIASNGGSKLNINVEKMSSASVVEFVDKVMAAKAERAEYLIRVKKPSTI